MEAEEDSLYVNAVVGVLGCTAKQRCGAATPQVAAV
jgi:hypothetical protein